MNGYRDSPLYGALLYIRLVAVLTFVGEQVWTFVVAPLTPTVYVLTLGIAAASLIGNILLDNA